MQRSMTSEFGRLLGPLHSVVPASSPLSGAMLCCGTGDSNYGGNSSAVQPLTKVRDICGSMGAFAALKAGQVPCYGTT